MRGFPNILSAAQTRKADAYTIENEPIASIDLMERASNAFVKAFCELEKTSATIAVLCGPGNNGGHGLAISRLLQVQGYQANPYLLQLGKQLSVDCQSNFERLSKVTLLDKEAPIPDFSVFDVVIDALFGSGLQRPLAGYLATLVDAVNQSGARVYSVDIASGLFCDTILDNPVAIKADMVISFQRPKKAFFYPEYGAFIKHWKVVDIGLDETFMEGLEGQEFVLDDAVAQLLKRRPRYSHKGTYGHALIVAGSYGKMGAAVLAAKACLKSGAGLVTAHIPTCGYTIVQTSVPEVMCSLDHHTEFWTMIPDISAYTTIGTGPGIGQEERTLKALATLLSSFEKPMVLDADAINLLAKNKDLIHLIPKGSVVTPHLKEFDRLLGPSSNSQERYDKQIAFAQKHELVVVLKDAHTAIADPDGNLFFNTSGNPGMATAGSGDVLTGVIAALLSQGHPPLEAAQMGVYFHGNAGDEAAKKHGEMGVMASDIIEELSFKRTSPF